jgi:hypothetical protein
MVPFSRRVSLFGLAPWRVYRARPVTSSAVSSYLTFSPLPHIRKSEAVYFLWHYPSGLPAQSLTGPLPFGVRTFLYRNSGVLIHIISITDYGNYKPEARKRTS